MCVAERHRRFEEMHDSISVRIEVRRIVQVGTDIFDCCFENVEPVVEHAELDPVDEHLVLGQAGPLGETARFVRALAM